MKGKFIVIEGLDGAGTTTQTKMLAENLAAQNIPVLSTKEPFQGEISGLIRKILSGEPEFQVYRSSMTWLYMADREYHLRTCIEPAIQEGKIVISDRYVPSTMAYQSEKGDLYPYTIFNLHQNSHFKTPDLVIYINTPVENCLERMKNRDHQEIFEEKKFLTGVAKRYQNSFQILKGYKWNIVEVDGSLSPEVINQQIIEIIMDLK